MTLFSKKKRRKNASAAFGDGEARDENLHVWIPAHREGVHPEVWDHRIGVGEGHLGRSLGGLARLKCGAAKKTGAKESNFPGEDTWTLTQPCPLVSQNGQPRPGYRANKPAT